VLGTDSKKSPQGLLLIGDSLRLAQVFRNVVSNALKFSFRGTTVEIHARWHPDRLLDAGNGLNE
jgi:signal transduction histidine kinase